MAKVVSTFTLLFLIVTNVCYGLDPASYIAESQKLELHLDPQWLSLGHYEATRASGWKSLVDDPQFFFSPNGRLDPQAELEETIKALLADDLTNNSAQCKFPARYVFLRQKLNFPSTHVANCPRFSAWINEINPFGITLVFPTTFINNPASSFGHTLIRIDQPATGEGSRLLAYAANYAAAVENDNLFTYAFNGIFGGYRGYFTIEPYYERLKQYADYENRDIWEYQLNFSPTETAMLAYHLWEIKDHYLDYYYFDDNCSYLLLSLLEVGRPGLKLKIHSRPWIVPLDTIKTITTENHLVTQINYRPSPATTLAYNSDNADDTTLQLTHELADEALNISDLMSSTALTSEHKAQSLELAYDYLVYKNEGIIADDQTQKRALELLAARSRLDVSLPQNPVPQPNNRPDQGHDTALFSLYSKMVDSNFRGGIRLRPTYHELVDPDVGYTHGSQLAFFDLAIAYDELDGLILDNFEILKISSLSPRSEFIRPISYQIKGGLSERPVAADDNALASFFNLGAGLTYNLGQQNIVYALATINNTALAELDDHYILGLGGEFGLNLYFTDSLAAIITASPQSYLTAESGFAIDTRQEIRYAVTPHQAIRLSSKYTKDPYYEWQEYSLFYDFFF